MVPTSEQIQAKVHNFSYRIKPSFPFHAASIRPSPAASRGVSRNIVKNLPPKYTYTELQSMLEIDPQLPDNIKEQDFLMDIKDNTKIKWRVNHFLFKKELLPFLLDSSTFRKWKILKSLNWLIALAIIGFAIWTQDYKILLFLIIFQIKYSISLVLCDRSNNWLSSQQSN